jgi:sialate O-acetylesterase
MRLPCSSYSYLLTSCENISHHPANNMNTSKAFRTVGLAAAILWSGALLPSAMAEVRLPKVFGSHMVLQREMPVVIWGWAQPNETVTVTLASATAQAQANEHGEWKVVLPAMKAGGPFILKVTGSSSLVLDDVMIGEVWLCSGQSNMEFGMSKLRDAQKEIAEANQPGLRLLLVKRKPAAAPQTGFQGDWKICSPQTIVKDGWAGFSAVAYFFGRELNQKLGVSIGLIESSWGGTSIEPWTPPEGFAAVPALSKEYALLQLADPANPQRQPRLNQALDENEKWIVSARQAVADHAALPPMPVFPREFLPPSDEKSPTALYNGMIHPLCPFALRGAIWYQGEANLADGLRYTDKMKALIGGWRSLWHEGDFPFYFVQIAPYNYGRSLAKEPAIWEAQAAVPPSVPNTGMAVINDIGNLNDIHPTDKLDVGHRLALLALAKTYGYDKLVCSGPTFQSLSIEGGKLRVNFDHVGGGLASRDGKPLDWFEIIDADGGDFVKADAQIDGSSVLLSAPDVKHPVAMRYAWSMMAEPHLMNTEGLPASAFRAGTVPKHE